MMRCIVGVLGALALAFPGAAPAADVTTVSGTVTYVSTSVVEVSGHRGLLEPGTSITSEGRPISIASVAVGMPADLEIGADGRALELRVKGAVE
ncbi:hypothetical protein K2Z84_33975 [Candidatus Binatia bacterium]|jgi:hypothetical protein|nr:hypothetical protein [Candidatus Binatia bacterium]